MKRRDPNGRQLGLEALWGGQPRPSAPQASPEVHRLELADAQRLERNVAILAGAGTGKTYSLVTMCLHLLAGAREGRVPIPPSRLGLLTFTEKAASEMRGRLRRRLSLLADGLDDERELRASLERLGRPQPDRAFWCKVLDELGSATIGTFHALCTQLLRRAPPGSGVNPHFELLDEREARQLLQEVVERVVLRRLHAPELSELVREWGFGDGVVAGLTVVASRIREEGFRARFVRVEGLEQARAEFDELVLEARREVEAVLPVLKPASATAREVTALQHLLSEASFERWPEIAAMVRARRFSTDSSRHLSRYTSLVRECPEKSLAALYGACRMAPHEAAVRDVLEEVERDYAEQLERRGVLDFTGLLLEARGLLQDFPEARREAQGRFQALLVDEFQDTNRVQLDLVLLLSEERSGAPRPVSECFEPNAGDELLRLPLEPAFLAVVGDRKQAIYEFRGADVSVFDLMAARIVACGGARAFLQDSRRSSPGLLTAVNALMTRVLEAERFGGRRHDFEIAYSPAEDDLRALRPEESSGAPIVKLVSKWAQPPPAEELRAMDADAIGRYLAQLLASEEPVVVDRDGLRRRVRGGDVALLFQRFTHLELYRQALVRHKVRHRVVRGRGFFGAQEVVDLASLLRLVADPSDALALAAVLRSPLVGLSDAALVGLALPRGLLPREVLEGAADLSGLTELEQTRLMRFCRTFASLRRERDRLGLRALLRVAMSELDFEVAVAGAPFGEQALANLDKLLDLAFAREKRGVGVAAFARELLELSEREPNEAQGEVLDALDSEVVTLCTVHQAKGLEWPIVVLPELAAAARNESDRVRFDRSVGLALRPLSTDEVEAATARRHEEIKAVSQRRRKAESLRLLYVALTRARDRLVLGLMPTGRDTWANELVGKSWADVERLTETVDIDSLPAGRAPSEPALEAQQARREVEALVGHLRAAPSAQAARAVLPVTQLQEFVTCPRRFHWAHQVGLSERPEALEWREGDGDARSGDPRERGTAAHKLLELTPLEAVPTSRLETVLRELRRSEELPDDEQDSVLGWVLRFWRSDFGQRLAVLGEARVHRELPFMLRLDGGDGFSLHLRGQIDLLVEDGGALVVDYKTSVEPAAGLEPYRFQLGCYALAAHQFVEGRAAVRAGISFLREADTSPRTLASLPEAAELERELVEQARALTRCQVRGVWDGRAPERCRALGCGYLYRCHPA